MESRNRGASSKGVLVPVAESTDFFQNNILAPLKSAYLYEESEQSFRYKSAVVIQNPALEEKYNTFRAKRSELGCSEEDLKESYGFLLFDDVDKANALGETGVLTGNSTCTTLGDPLKGVYVSMYSDCLDLNRWYHGKSGYIAIIKLTKGRVKRVLENYTQNFTAPTVGFDCHVSEQLSSVSAKTSSFLAFERTQYYIYELLDDGSNETAQSPSAACPFAIISFSYTDTKATLVAPQEKSEENKLVCHYFPWRGQLQIGTQFYDVRLRSTEGALIPAELPPVVKVDRAISMLDLRRLLPRAVFETCFSGEVFLDGLYCSLCELVSSKVAETNPLSLLLWEIKEKDVALTIPLNDGGFIFLLHSSHFLTYDDTWSSATEVLQCMFMFPDSRVIQRDTKFGQRQPAISSEILQVLPALSYAEGEVEKTPTDPSEELCEVLAQHMQSYAALINPGLALSPSRELSIFSDQYDVLDAHKHLYSSPDWTNRGWQGVRSYLRKPVSFQLPVSKVSEILAGQDEQIEDLDDDVYICPSSPEEAPTNPVGMGSEDRLPGPNFSRNVETSVDSSIPCSKAKVDSTAVPENVVPDDFQSGHATKDTKKMDLGVLIKADDVLTPSTSYDLPAELIVSFTSAERTFTEESLSVISSKSATQHNDFQLSGFSTAKLTTGVNSLNDKTVKTKKVLVCPEVAYLTKTKRSILRRGHCSGWKRVSKACVETPSLQTVTIPVEDDNFKSQKEDQSNTDWRKVRRRKRKFGKISSKNKKERPASVGLAVTEEKESNPEKQQSLESTILMELEACPLRKKMERWDLKPVISECGRILVPHGSVDIADQIRSLKDKLQSSKNEQCSDEMLVGSSVNAHDTVKMKQESSNAPETAVDETASTSKGGGNKIQNTLVSHVNPENSLLRQSEDGSSEHSSKDYGTDIPTSEVVQEEHSDTLSPGNCATNCELLLSKLKSVLLRGKRKADPLVSEETAADTAQNTEHCFKMSKVDSDTGIVLSNAANTSVQDTNVGVKEASKMQSVDPLFAYALGLTPKDTQDKIQKTEGQGTQQRKDSSETQEQTTFDKQALIIQRSPSIFPKRGRIKTLKKHQGISEEYVKKKWWLHFQTPAGFASEKLKYKECSRDNTLSKTVKEKMNSACSSTDALNLLADLALSVSNDQVPQQPDPTHERKPETSLKKCDHTEDVTSAEQLSSVIHALLRQPSARPIPSLESPSPSHLVECSDLVGLVSKEHAYSLPPASSLLLGLLGTPFQVSPLSGSTRLLHNHQTMYGDGIKTLHPSVALEDRSEHNHRTPEYLRKHKVCRRKFRHSRTFVNKDGSVQVTKKWKENYDFNLDSKFTNDPKDKAIIRALHGPWDFSVQDTSEDVRLIVHMWIGLFYSRSTDRFFHVDSNLSHPCSEESDSLEISSGMVPTPATSELKANSLAHLPSVTNTTDPSKALDLSKKDDSVLDQGSMILDLTLRNCNATIVTSDPQVHRKKTSVFGELKEASETVNTLKSSIELQEASTSQCYGKRVNSTEIINKENTVRSSYENKRTSQKAGQLKHIDVASFKGDGPCFPLQKKMESLSVPPEYNQTASGIGNVLHKCNKGKADLKDDAENSGATEMSLVQKHKTYSSKSGTEERVDKEKDDLVHTVDQYEIASTYGESWDVIEKLYQEGNMELFQKMIQRGNELTNKESDIICNENPLENQKQVSSEGPKAVSPGKAENVFEDVDCCTVHELFGKEDGLNERDSCVSAMEVDSDLSDQPLLMMCDGPNSVKKGWIKEFNRQAKLDEKPPQADNENVTCHNLQLRKLCINGSALTDEHAVSEKGPHAPSEMEPIYNEPAVEENSENFICLAFKTHDQKTALPMSDENTSSLDVSYTDRSITQTNDSVETVYQNKLMANVNLSNDDNEGTKSVVGEQMVDNTTQKELFYQSHLPQCQVTIKCEAEVALTKERDLNNRKTNEVLEKIHSVVVIPFIGIDTLGEDTVSPYDSHSQGKVEKVVQDQKGIECLSETTYPETVLPTEVCSRSQMLSPVTKTELSAGKMSLSLLDASKINQPEISGRESYERFPTATMVEKPYEYLACFGPRSSSSSAFGGETCKSMTQKCLGRGSQSIMDEMQKPCQKSTVNSDLNPHHDLHPDLELRTLTVLQNIGKFFSTQSHTKKSCQIETDAVKSCLDQIHNASGKLAPSHTSTDLKDEEISDTKPSVASFSTSRERQTESSGHCLLSRFKSKLEQELCVRLQLKKSNPTTKDYCNLHRYFPSTECLQCIKHNIDQDRHKTTLQTNLSHEPSSYSQRPVMAVKPSKSDESQADCVSKDRQNENSVMSRNKKTKMSIVTYTPTSMFSEKKTKGLERNFEGLNDKQEANELSSKCNWLSNVPDSKSNSVEATFAYLDEYEEREISKFNKIPSSLLVQSIKSAKSSFKLVDGNQDFMTSLVEKVGQTTKESIEINQKDYSDASTSLADYKYSSIEDDSLFMRPRSSLICTVYNTSRKRSYSFLEQLSQRCLQDDPTQVSMEQECLIFSEQMKQLLKRSKKGSICQPDADDKFYLSCDSPVTVHFSSLEEQEDLVDHWDTPSLVRQKIKVDMSDRRNLVHTTEEEKTLYPQKLSQGPGNPMEYAGVSGVTAECPSLYEAMRNEVCAAKKVSSRPTQFRMDRGYPKTEPRNHFDFCYQMKREADEGFFSNLNSVLKKSCKTKYRFYILVTSDDAFFEETKAQLVAEGQTAIQPSEFFLGENDSSSLLIILKNEDIAEHICEVPHLLELKQSPGVQFAGIDEPNDIVNLSHQELFTRGGFVMFDRGALESLSICNMKKMSEILQELSRTGKWKWMLHYRDSRRLKENARLSAEANEKKHYLNWCQEAGMLEILPYHECDHMSRDQPDYLPCLVRLQVQNISARFPVFITDATTDSTFGRNGILAMNFNSFLACSTSEIFTV